MSLNSDSEVQAALQQGLEGIAVPEERDRVQNFMEADAALQTSFSPANCETLAAAARMAYDNRTPQLHRGWIKVILVQTGIAGSELGSYDQERSYEIMKWSYDGCKALGYTIDDVDTGSAMGRYMFDLNQWIIAAWSPSMEAVQNRSSAAPAATAGSGCLVASLCLAGVLNAAVRRGS